MNRYFFLLLVVVAASGWAQYVSTQTPSLLHTDETIGRGTGEPEFDMSTFQPNIASPDITPNDPAEKLMSLLNRYEGAERLLALAVLADLAQTFANVGQFSAIATLPPEMLFTVDLSNPLSLVRCPPNTVAVSLYQCATSAGPSRPIQGSCFGSASYSTSLGHCFTLSEARPTPRCPEGYKIAKFPTDKYFGSCKLIATEPAALNCDPPFQLEDRKCVYYTADYGYIGCAVGSVPAGDGTNCKTASQKLKVVECSPGYEPILQSDGTGICTKKVTFRGNYFETPKCPVDTQEHLDYINTDDSNKPVVTCETTENRRGVARCQFAKQYPYNDYVKLYSNSPPVLLDGTLGHPDRTCVEIELQPVAPTCPDPVRQDPYISPGRRIIIPLKFDHLLPMDIIAEEINPDWSSFELHSLPLKTTYAPRTLSTLNDEIMFTPKSELSHSTLELIESSMLANTYYRTLQGRELTIACLTRQNAQPTLQCAEGYVQKKRDPTLCRKHKFADFVLNCPVNHQLNEFDLVHQADRKAEPLCIGRLRARTQYFCPSRGDGETSGVHPMAEPNLMTAQLTPTDQAGHARLYPEHPLYLPDPLNKRCIYVSLVQPQYTPPSETVNALFPQYVRLLINNDIRYPGSKDVP